MKALKCKPSAQFAYNYTINVSSKCDNIISHRSLVFEGRHNAIDLRRSAHRSSIFESRHIDLRRSTHRSSIFEGRHIGLRRSKAETSYRQPNIAPTTQHPADIPTIRHRILSTTALHTYYTQDSARYISKYRILVYNIIRKYTRPYIRYIRKQPHNMDNTH